MQIAMCGKNELFTRLNRNRSGNISDTGKKIKLANVIQSELDNE